MSEEQTYAKLTEIFRDIFDDDTIVLHPDMTAGDIEGWDSFNHISIVVASEAAFDVKFKSAEIEDLKNVGEFVRLINQAHTA